jgi:hypothetical protein
MARYNTIVSSASVSSAATLSAPNAGLFTELTGSTYSVTIGDPTLYAGQSQVFYNSASGSITLVTPSGIFSGPASSGTSSQVIPAASTLTLYSNGTNWVTAFDGGGILVATTGTFSGNMAFNGTQVRSSSAQTTTTNYDLINLLYLQTNYGQTWSIQNGNFNATTGGRYFVDTSSTAVTATLPGTPTIGDRICFVDLSGTFATRNLTVAPGASNRIMRSTLNNNMTVATTGAAFELVFSNTANGWLMANGI